MKVTITQFSTPLPSLRSTMPTSPDQRRPGLLDRQKQSITTVLARNSALRDKEVKDRVKREGGENRVPRSITPPTWTVEEIESAQEASESKKNVSKVRIWRHILSQTVRSGFSVELRLLFSTHG